jgi:hypothetical protein
MPPADGPRPESPVTLRSGTRARGGDGKFARLQLRVARPPDRRRLLQAPPHRPGRRPRRPPLPPSPIPVPLPAADPAAAAAGGPQGTSFFLCPQALVVLFRFGGIDCSLSRWITLLLLLLMILLVGGLFFFVAACMYIAGLAWLL